jgi:hypothetical protein
MKFFSRVVFAFALLCGLAYGSFAFGKYVLSNKLFGDGVGGGALRTVTRSTSEASAVTRHTNWKGSKPRVEVRMLPADEAGPAPQASALADEDNLSTKRRADDEDEVSTTSSASSRAAIKERHFDDAPIEYSLGEKEARARRRRKAKKKAEPTPTPADAASISSDDTPGDAQPNQTSTRDDEISISSAPRVKKSESRADSGSSSPRRARRSRTVKEPRLESPIPQPENATSSSKKSGGDSADISPVPQPE